MSLTREEYERTLGYRPGTLTDEQFRKLTTSPEPRHLTAHMDATAPKLGVYGTPVEAAPVFVPMTIDERTQFVAPQWVKGREGDYDHVDRSPASFNAPVTGSPTKSLPGAPQVAWVDDDHTAQQIVELNKALAAKRQADAIAPLAKSVSAAVTAGFGDDRARSKKGGK